MIFDHRTYFCHPGKIKAQMELYQAHGLRPQTRHLGQPVLYGTTEIGDVNSYVHVWAYADLADRAAKRAAMQADPEWQAFLKLSSELGALIRQENKILVAPAFFTLPGR